MNSGSPPFIWTHSQLKFYPLDPRPEDVRIEDIAHALAQMCRANGHFKHFYSVAQHSINCALEARARGLSKRLQLACLLHDASEAYIADLNRPVKQCLKEYAAIETKLQRVIFNAFHLTSLTNEEWSIVDDIDNNLLHFEFEKLHGQKLVNNRAQLFSSPDVSAKDIAAVDAEFLRQFQKIANQRRILKSVGIDGCERGWAVFWIDSYDAFGFETCETIGDVFPRHDDADSVLIDIPIGLPEEAGEIRPDGELRRQLKGKASCVFETPCRQAVYAHSPVGARELNKRFMKKSLSSQSIGFSQKIREVDEFLRKNPHYIGKIRESHPEYAFSMLNGGAPILSRKKEDAGREDRLAVLQKHFGQARRALDEQRARGYPVSMDNDILDSMVLAVMGLCGIVQGFETIPNNPPRDRRGLPMEIIYCWPKD